MGREHSLMDSLDPTGKVGSLCQGVKVVNGPNTSGMPAGVWVYLKIVCLRGLETAMSFYNMLLLLSRSF